MVSSIRKLSDMIYKLEKFLVTILIPVMFITMVLNVLFRYLLNSPLIWAQEVTLFAFGWACFLGASMSIKQREAVAVTILVDKIKSSFRNIAIIAGLFVSSVFIVSLVYLSISWIIQPIILMQYSTTMQIPMLIPYLCIPISFLFMSVHIISWLLESIRKSKEGKVIE